MACSRPNLTESQINALCDGLKPIVAKCCDARGHVSCKDISYVNAWHIGDYLDQNLGMYKISYMDGPLGRIGRALDKCIPGNYGPSWFKRFIKLRRGYSLDSVPSQSLSWKQVEALCRIKDAASRLMLTEAAAQGGWDEDRIGLHACCTNINEPPEFRPGYSKTPKAGDRAVTYLQAYADTCGFIAAEELERRYCVDVDEPLAAYEFREAAWAITVDADTGDGAFGLMCENRLMICARELDAGERSLPYSHDMYRCSWGAYERRDHYRKRMFEAEARRVRMVRADIESAHASVPPKRLAFDSGFTWEKPYERQGFYLKQMLLRAVDTQDSGVLDAGAEFDFAFKKLVSYVSETGYPTFNQAYEDLGFLLGCVRGRSVDDGMFNMLLKCLIGVYRRVPLWRQSGYSFIELSVDGKEEAMDYPEEHSPLVSRHEAAA